MEEFIGKKVSVAETNTLLCDRSELTDGVVIGHDTTCELFRVMFTYKKRRQEFSMLIEELVFED